VNSRIFYASNGFQVQCRRQEIIIESESARKDISSEAKTKFSLCWEKKVEAVACPYKYFAANAAERNRKALYIS